jgi:hypothetical protein
MSLMARRPFQQQGQRRGEIGERLARTNAGGVQDDQDDGLDGDAAQDVADGHVELMGDGGAGGDRDLR